MSNTFTTHTGQIISGEALNCALKTVADDWRNLAHRIRADQYAAHVTEAQKDATLNRMLLRADEIEAGNYMSFTIWQRVNTVLTGVCAPLLHYNPTHLKIAKTFLK